MVEILFTRIIKLVNIQCPPQETRHSLDCSKVNDVPILLNKTVLDIKTRQSGDSAHCNPCYMLQEILTLLPTHFMLILHEHLANNCNLLNINFPRPLLHNLYLIDVQIRWKTLVDVQISGNYSTEFPWNLTYFNQSGAGNQ